MYNYSLYIRKVLRQVHPDTTITKDALSQVNSMINTVCNRLAQKAAKLAVYSNHKTIREEEIQSAVRLIIPRRISVNMLYLKGQVRWLNLMTKAGERAGRRAGIEFSISRVESQLRKNACNNCRVSKNASVYLAAVLDYLSAEILELAGNVARDNRHSRITVRDLMLTVKEDDELPSLFRHRVFVGGGVKPHINYLLL